MNQSANEEWNPPRRFNSKKIAAFILVAGLTSLAALIGGLVWVIDSLKVYEELPPEYVSWGSYEDFVSGKAKAPCHFPMISGFREIPKESFVDTGFGWHARKRFYRGVNRVTQDQEIILLQRFHTVKSWGDYWLIEMESFTKPYDQSKRFCFALLVYQAPWGSTNPYSTSFKSRPNVLRAWVGNSGDALHEVEVMSAEESEAYIRETLKPFGPEGFPTGVHGGIEWEKVRTLYSLPEDERPFPLLDWDSLWQEIGFGIKAEQKTYDEAKTKILNEHKVLLASVGVGADDTMLENRMVHEFEAARPEDFAELKTYLSKRKTYPVPVQDELLGEGGETVFATRLPMRFEVISLPRLSPDEPSKMQVRLVSPQLKSSHWNLRMAVENYLNQARFKHYRYLGWKFSEDEDSNR